MNKVPEREEKKKNKKPKTPFLHTYRFRTDWAREVLYEVSLNWREVRTEMNSAGKYICIAWFLLFCMSVYGCMVSILHRRGQVAADGSYSLFALHLDTRKDPNTWGKAKKHRSIEENYFTGHGKRDSWETKG